MTDAKLRADQECCSNCFTSLSKEGDVETLALLELLVRAIDRGDEAMVQGLIRLAEAGQRDGEPVKLQDAEVAVLRRVSSICKHRERVAWGRALAHAYVRGDRLRVSMILELADKRCAA